MKSGDLYKEVTQVNTIEGITGIFESIASMRIARIKSKVDASQRFFEELWAIYSQLRVDPSSRMTANNGPRRKKPNVFLVLTSQGGLSGDIDERIVARVLQDYDPKTTDLLVIGSHGANLLTASNIKIERSFKLPDTDEGVDEGPIIQALSGYQNPSVYYQKYVSLAVQEPDRINLLSRVQALGNDSVGNEVISVRDYVFEPSVEEVVGYLEGVMLEIALAQVILDTRLAQYAARFSAMSGSHKRAQELQKVSLLNYNRSKRRENDDRLKEVITAMKLS